MFCRWLDPGMCWAQVSALGIVLEGSRWPGSIRRCDVCLQADEHCNAMYQAAHARAHRPSDSPAAAINSCEAQRRVLECASLSYDHPEVALAAMMQGLQREPLGSEQQQLLWSNYPQHKQLLQSIQDVLQRQEAEMQEGQQGASTAAALLTEHYLHLEGKVWSVLPSLPSVFCLFLFPDTFVHIVLVCLI